MDVETARQLEAEAVRRALAGSDMLLLYLLRRLECEPPRDEHATNVVPFPQ